MTEKVLLVDDEVDFLDTLSERMKDRGMNVSTTTSAEEALKRWMPSPMMPLCSTS